MKTTVVKSALGKWFVMQDDEPISDQFDTNEAAWRWYDKHSKVEQDSDGRQQEIQEHFRQKA